MNVLRGRTLAALLTAAASVAAPLSAQEVPVVERSLSNGMKLSLIHI